MKASLGFDPYEHDYGPATFAVRRILTAWSDVDWFTPPPNRSRARPAADALAPPYRAAPDEPQYAKPSGPGMRCFEEHLAVAHRAAPSLVVPSACIETRADGWAAFWTLRTRLRNQRWDWKFQCLKAMTRAHTEARGWSAKDFAPEATALDASLPGHLCCRVGDAVIWTLGPRADFSALAPAEADVAKWYLDHATLDLLDAVQWQLADACEGLEGNPFVPLIGAYAAGFYPFGLAPDHFVGVSFAA